jgi:diguanylate cyclase (GGDEF)-like protein
MLKSEARDGDIVTQLGGDEFAIWMERSDQDEATRRGEGLLAASLAMRGDFSPNPEKPFGLSVGMACFVPGSGETLEQLVARGDRAMYEIKKGGKNSFALASPHQTD